MFERSMNFLGLRFGRLLVLSKNPSKKHRQIHWNCICDCGKEMVLSSTKLSYRKQRSCGCLALEINAERSTTHGHRKNGQRSREYRIWSNMKDRCLNSRESTKRYFGRGISVCERWVNSYENFIADMGVCPSPKHSIDRIDVNGNYDPANCRWATHREQFRNKTNNRWIEFNGWEFILKDWADLLGTKPPSLHQLIDKKSVNGAFMHHVRRLQRMR